MPFFGTSTRRGSALASTTRHPSTSSMRSGISATRRATFRSRRPQRARSSRSRSTQASRTSSRPSLPRLSVTGSPMAAEETFIHERALVETDEIGTGTRVWAFAQVMSGARVGAGCNICGHAFIEQGAVVGDRVTVKNSVQVWDGVTIEDDVFLGPNATFTNDLTPRARIKKSSEQLLRTVVRRGATIGANATVLCGITIGEFGFVAAGAVVTRDVVPYALVVGNPGRRVGWACQCGGRLPDDLRCRSCGRRYRQTASESIALIEDDIRSSR